MTENKFQTAENIEAMRDKADQKLHPRRGSGNLMQYRRSIRVLDRDRANISSDKIFFLTVFSKLHPKNVLRFSSIFYKVPFYFPCLNTCKYDNKKSLVIYEEIPHFKSSCLHRVVYVKPLDKLENLPNI